MKKRLFFKILWKLFIYLIIYCKCLPNSSFKKTFFVVVKCKKSVIMKEDISIGNISIKAQTIFDSHSCLSEAKGMIITMKNNIEKKRELNIPIYLNQKIVFDMLATIEDGFSNLTTIQTSSEKNSSGEISSEIGNSNVFALIGVKLRGALKGENTDLETSSTDKVHTPSSLFQKLRDHFYKANLIIHIDNSYSISELKAGDFIEIEGDLSKNPLVSVIDSCIQMMEVISAFQSSTSTKPKSKENKQIITQMKAISSGLQSGDIVDLICQSNCNGKIIKTVLPVYNDYFFNKNMNEITDGQYRVIGKVTKVTYDDGDSINLLRNTSFSLMQQATLDKMFNTGFQNEDMKKAGIEIPNISTTFSGPAVMILPIAVFV